MLDGSPSDSLDYALGYMPTVRDMFAALLRYQRLMHDAAASVIEARADGVAVVLHSRARFVAGRA